MCIYNDCIYIILLIILTTDCDSSVSAREAQYLYGSAIRLGDISRRHASGSSAEMPDHVAATYSRVAAAASSEIDEMPANMCAEQ